MTEKYPRVKTKEEATEALKAVWQDMLDFLTPSNDEAINSAVDDLRRIVHALEG